MMIFCDFFQNLKTVLQSEKFYYSFYIFGFLGGISGTFLDFLVFFGPFRYEIYFGNQITCYLGTVSPS